MECGEGSAWRQVAAPERTARSAQRDASCSGGLLGPTEGAQRGHRTEPIASAAASSRGSRAAAYLELEAILPVLHPAPAKPQRLPNRYLRQRTQ